MVHSKIHLAAITAEESQLPEVIKLSMGLPDPIKVQEIMNTYSLLGHELRGAFLDRRLIGMIGLIHTKEYSTIRHLSVLPNFQREGIGTVLLESVKENCASRKIIAETDEEAVGFYLKTGFTCSSFQGTHGNLRYKCEWG